MIARNPRYCPATIFRVGTRRAKNRVSRTMSSMFVAAKVVTLAVKIAAGAAIPSEASTGRSLQTLGPCHGRPLKWWLKTGEE